jgi:hypothetical protein
VALWVYKQHEGVLGEGQCAPQDVTTTYAMVNGHELHMDNVFLHPDLCGDLTRIRYSCGTISGHSTPNQHSSQPDLQ